MVHPEKPGEHLTPIEENEVVRLDMAELENFDALAEKDARQKKEKINNDSAVA